MADLISMEQAAAMLGISVDELAELRSQKEIFAVSVGSNWKFKMPELERFADERGISLGGQDDQDFHISDDDIGLADPNAEVSEQDSGKEVSSESIELEDDSVDLILEDDSEESLMLSDSSDLLSSDPQGSELRFGESDLRLAAESSNLLDQGKSSDLLSDQGPGSDRPSETGNLSDEWPWPKTSCSRVTTCRTAPRWKTALNWTAILRAATWCWMSPAPRSR